MDFSESRERIVTKFHAFGYKVRDEGDFIVVSLPLFSKIRIAFGPESIDVSPRFGALSRGLTTWTILLAALGCAGLLWMDSLPTHRVAYVSFLVLVGALWDVYRYVLTENMITRIHYWLE